MPQIDGIVWVICGLGLLLSATAALALYSAARVAGRDDRHMERHRPRRAAWWRKWGGNG